MGLIRRSNSRQIPSTIDYTSHLLYNDLIYGYLQSISLPGLSGSRYVLAKDATRAQLSRTLGLSPPTIRKYFEGMQELLLIGPKEHSRYELTFIGNDYAYLVPLDVLEAIIKKRQARVLSIYIWCLEMAFHNPIITYSLTSFKNVVGLSPDTSDNGHIIKEALDILQDLNLIKHYSTTVMDNGVFKSKKVITNVTNILEEK